MVNLVSFDEEPTRAPQVTTTKSSFFARMFIRMGISKSETEANIILAILSIAIMVGSIALFIGAQPKPHVLNSQQELKFQSMLKNAQP